MNNKIKLVIGLVALVLVLLPGFVMADNTFGDITCTEKFVSVHRFECRRPDMSLEKVFQTYDQMIAWYDPYRDVTFIPEVTYYWTVSNMGI